MTCCASYFNAIQRGLLGRGTNAMYRLLLTRSECSTARKPGCLEDQGGKLAIICPGQGTQSVGMGRQLYETSETARNIFETANQALKFPITNLMFNGPLDELSLTKNAQPAILTNSIALLAILKEQFGDVPGRASAVLGHSVGEYTALVAAGSLSLADAVVLTRERGRLMQSCVGPEDSAMAVLMPCSADTAMQLAAEAVDRTGSGAVCNLAAVNSPFQVTISGTKDAVGLAMQLAKTKGVRRCVKMEVSCAFHSQLLVEVERPMRALLKAVEMTQPCSALVANATAAKVSEVASIKELLVQNICGTVQWAGSIQACKELGISRYIELGDKAVLLPLVKQCDREASCRTVPELCAEPKANEWFVQA